jgi:hypothetical protein
MKFDKGVESAWWALRIGLGVAPVAAGLDRSSTCSPTGKDT